MPTEGRAGHHSHPGLLAVPLQAPLKTMTELSEIIQSCGPSPGQGYAPGANVLMQKELATKGCNTLGLGPVGSEVPTTKPGSRETPLPGLLQKALL